MKRNRTREIRIRMLSFQPIPISCLSQSSKNLCTQNLLADTQFHLGDAFRFFIQVEHSLRLYITICHKKQGRKIRNDKDSQGAG